MTLYYIVGVRIKGNDSFVANNSVFLYAWMLYVQVDPYAAEPKSQHLFQQLESLMEAQEDAVTQV